MELKPSSDVPNPIGRYLVTVLLICSVWIVAVPTFLALLAIGGVVAFCRANSPFAMIERRGDGIKNWPKPTAG